MSVSQWKTRFQIQQVVLVAVVLVTVYVGWRTLWFLTDDAFIAFRYVSNHMRGFGLTWNPPPFAPVEGYTSFLWVMILEFVWRVTGIEPPQAANWISLGFGYATLFLIHRFMMRMRLPQPFAQRRFLLVSLVMLGTITNRTFLTWLSSGLETALFNFCLTWWVYVALTPREERKRYWSLGLCASSVAAAWARPDGLLFYAATLVIIAIHYWSRGEHAARTWQTGLALVTLFLVPGHFVFRFLTYGAWLPNTYYAKYVTTWPESGIRYFASFVVENGVWVWLCVLIVWLGFRLAQIAKNRRWAERGPLHVWIGLSAILLHLAYYTFVIGGDHFEYRVYSHLVPLLFVSTVWLISRCTLRLPLALVTLVMAIFVSWPVPWVHWSRTHDIVGRENTHFLIVPVAPAFPGWLQPLIGGWDSWQAWLIRQSVCVRHQEHKVFCEDQIAKLPSREEGSEIRWSERGIGVATSVGVLGWVLPEIAIIDRKGLKDRVIARNPVHPGIRKLMAHERMPPAGYVDCFRPNLMPINSPDSIILIPRQPPLTDDEIRACEEQDWY